jgi:hypothetical protein
MATNQSESCMWGLHEKVSKLMLERKGVFNCGAQQSASGLADFLEIARNSFMLM